MIAIDDREIARIERNAQNKAILVALSGGGDSTALLYILLDAFGAERLRVCVVDHALRQGSADDAKLACERARALGVEAEIKTLSWPNGPKTSQAAARAARYRALCDAARKQNIRLIALGHNADDQAETILMRTESGSGWRGLAGMRALAPAPVWPEGAGLWLARPLLNLRRADLRAMLTEKAAAWIEDPANANPDFARVRIRARLAEMERDGFEPQWLCEDALVYQARAAKHDRAARAVIDTGCRIEDGAAKLDWALWREADATTRRRVLSVIIAAIAGSEREPGPRAVERLEAALVEDNFRGGSLGGALIRRRADQLKFARDPGALLGRADGVRALVPLTLPERAPLIWDNRLELTASNPGWRVLPGPKGEPNFERGGRSHTLSEAETTQEIQAHWLTEAQIAHLLPHILFGDVSAFTPS